MRSCSACPVLHHRSGVVAEIDLVAGDKSDAYAHGICGNEAIHGAQAAVAHAGAKYAKTAGIGFSEGLHRNTALSAAQHD